LSILVIQNPYDVITGSEFSIWQATVTPLMNIEHKNATQPL